MAFMAREVMKTALRDTAGNVLKEIDLSDTVYAAAPNPDLLHQAPQSDR